MPLEPPFDTWCSWSRGDVQFATATSCDYLDIIYYPEGESTVQSRQCYEGTLDDESFPKWFEKVHIR